MKALVWSRLGAPCRLCRHLGASHNHVTSACGGPRCRCKTFTLKNEDLARIAKAALREGLRYVGVRGARIQTMEVKGTMLVRAAVVTGAWASLGHQQRQDLCHRLVEEWVGRDEQRVLVETWT